MLDSLRFVKGAVAKKDFIAALTHFQIKGGFVKGHNGGLTLCAPIDLNIDVTPKATTFIKAIETCPAAIALSVTATGRLAIKSGKFKAFVECVEEGFPMTEPEGRVIPLPQGGIVDAFKTLAPFIADDASRPWARGILLRGQSAYATNNVVLAEHWLGYEFPVPVNIPKSAVMEVCRIKEEPTHLQVCENSVTFFFEGGRWLKTQLYSLEWPDLNKVLNREAPQLTTPPETLWQALENVAPFTDKLRRVFFKDGVISTAVDEAAGASEEVEGLYDAKGIYNVDYLIELSAVVKMIDFSLYPGPILFFGDGIRGAIIGMRG